MSNCNCRCQCLPEVKLYPSNGSGAYASDNTSDIVLTYYKTDDHRLMFEVVKNHSGPVGGFVKFNPDTGRFS